MNKQLESIKTNKFKAIPNNVLSNILGKAGTGSGNFVFEIQRKYVTGDDGRTREYLRRVYMNYTSDDISSDSSCYYGTSISYGSWQLG